LSFSGCAAMIATVTHARIRASQGDVFGALRVLRGVLARSPHDADALVLYSDLTRLVPGVRQRRARMLTAWIERVRRRRGRRP
jgi:hypothetical protein